MPLMIWIPRKLDTKVIYECIKSTYHSDKVSNTWKTYLTNLLPEFGTSEI